jgi:hypothetical protein
MIMQTKASKPVPKTKPHRAPWFARISPKIFPLGPRRLYYYLLAFKSGRCYQWNYRLEAILGCSKRALQYQLAWLKKNRLIHIHNPFDKSRTICVHRFKSPIAWLKRMALPISHKKAIKTRLSQPEKEARRQALQGQLSAMSRGARNCTHKKEYIEAMYPGGKDVAQKAPVPPARKPVGHDGCEVLAATADLNAVGSQVLQPPNGSLTASKAAGRRQKIQPPSPGPITNAGNVAETTRRRRLQLAALFEVQA